MMKAYRGLYWYDSSYYNANATYARNSQSTQSTYVIWNQLDFKATTPKQVKISACGITSNYPEIKSYQVETSHKDFLGLF